MTSLMNISSQDLEAFINDYNQAIHTPTAERILNSPTNHVSSLIQDKNTAMLIQEQLTTAQDIKRPMVQGLFQHPQTRYYPRSVRYPSSTMLRQPTSSTYLQNLCRYYNIHLHPLTPYPNQYLKPILTIQTKVFNRLSKYPEDEDYLNTTEKLKVRVAELKEQNISQNRIAQHLRMTYRALDDIINDRKKRHTHCPWTLLEWLKNAESEIDLSKKKRHNVIHIAGDNYRGPETIPPITQDKTLIFNQPCPKCGSSWNNMFQTYEDESDQNNFFTCRICGNEGKMLPLQTDQPAALRQPSPKQSVQDQDYQPHEFITRYAPCWNCKAPWPNLKYNRNGQETVRTYTCTLCSQKNRVATSKFLWSVKR